MESLGWVVKLYHEETPYLKLIVRVTAKVIITPKFGMHILAPISLYPKRLQLVIRVLFLDWSPKVLCIEYSKSRKADYKDFLGGLGGLVPLPIKGEVYKGNKQLKPVAMAIFPPGIKGPELRKALRESLNSTLPIVFHDQIPPCDATVTEVRRWIKSWFVGRGKSSTAITKSINRLRWDGKCLWKHGNRQMQKDLEAVGISKAYSKALARDITVARNQFDGWRRVSTIVSFSRDSSFVTAPNIDLASGKAVSFGRASPYVSVFWILPLCPSGELGPGSTWS
jgi:hypothetical protein